MPYEQKVMTCIQSIWFRWIISLIHRLIPETHRCYNRPSMYRYVKESLSNFPMIKIGPERGLFMVRWDLNTRHNLIQVMKFHDFCTSIDAYEDLARTKEGYQKSHIIGHGYLMYSSLDRPTRSWLPHNIKITHILMQICVTLGTSCACVMLSNQFETLNLVNLDPRGLIETFSDRLFGNF